MRKTLLITTALMLVVGCSKTIDVDKLVERGGLLYEVNSDKPFSGEGVSYYSNGQKKSEVTFKDGELDGKWTLWYENGQKSQEEIYEDGKEIERLTWYENGQKEYEGTYIWMSSQYSGLKRFTESSKRWDQDGKITMENGWVY